MLPVHVGHLLKAGNPGTSLRFEYLKQGKYISGDERGGFNVAKVNLPLSDPRLRLFIQGGGRLVGGRTPCAGKEE
jgi:hypothetical protein